MLYSVLYAILVVGLPAIDKSLDGLLDYLNGHTPHQLGNLRSIAMSLGGIFALCVMAYECWMMMLGRRVIDVMKLFRIIGLSFCIWNCITINYALLAPGESLERTTKGMAKAMNAQVAKQEMVVAKLQDKYYQKVRALQDSIESAKRIQELGKDADWMDKIEYAVNSLGTSIDNFAKRAAIVTETKITEWANLIIRFIGEAIFQIAYYALLIMKVVFLKLLGLFCPIMFALSIIPPWSNAWAQWMSKYLSISLWGFVAYLCVYYADAILLYTLQKDITAYTALIGSTNLGSWESIGTLGMQGIGSTCMYFVGMCIGAVLIKSVPEVCSWLIPGAVSSSSAGSAGMSTLNTAVTVGTTVAATAQILSGSGSSALPALAAAAPTPSSAAPNNNGGNNSKDSSNNNDGNNSSNNSSPSSPSSSSSASGGSQSQSSSSEPPNRGFGKEKE